MIAHVRGQVVRRDTAAVVVDVHGIGWLVHVPDLQQVPPPGQDVLLHTSMQVREDSMDLYGFVDQDALGLFELLLTAAGVGPKLALAVLRTHPPATVRMAIAGGDQAVLTDVPGIGRKVAQRLVLELGDKVGPVDVAPAAPAGPVTTAQQEAREALVSLGWSDSEARAALEGASPDGSVEQLLRGALRAGAQ